VALVGEVRADFAARGVTAVVKLGVREVFQQTNQGVGGANRVVFSPIGRGRFLPPHLAGDRDIMNPDDPDKVLARVRALYDWERPVDVSVWAAAPQREDEEKQIEALETLLGETINAIHGAKGAFAAVVIDDPEPTPPAERAFGRELHFVMTLTTPIFQTPRELSYGAVGGVSRAISTT